MVGAVVVMRAPSFRVQLLLTQLWQGRLYSASAYPTNPDYRVVGGYRMNPSTLPACAPDQQRLQAGAYWAGKVGQPRPGHRHPGAEFGHRVHQQPLPDRRAE